MREKLFYERHQETKLRLNKSKEITTQFYKIKEMTILVKTLQH